MAAWLDYSLSNTEASVWPCGWIIHCPIQKYLCGRVVGFFIAQYRSICAAEWLDYSLSNTEASVQPSGWIIHCPIQKHLGSQVLGALDLGSGNEKIQQTKN